MKRKVLLGTNSFNQEPSLELNPPGANLQTGSLSAENMGNRSRTFATVGGVTGNLNSVVDDMEANRVRSHCYHLLLYLTSIIPIGRCSARHSSAG